MTKPKGGRGKKATYATAHIRCPKPLLPQVKTLINQFHEENETALNHQLGGAKADISNTPDQEQLCHVSREGLEKAIAILEECLALPGGKHPSKAKIKEAVECLKSG
ncbi:MAG: hypothetical protein LDL41_07535 [Coleofasciculus sp. S288]|nr:hypothetical protein [Coleofasciculus sp. S288]